MVTWNNVWLNQPCQSWTGGKHSFTTINGSEIGDILLISGTLDGGSAFEDNLEVRRRFPSAILVVVINGTNHAWSLSGNACVDNIVAEYLQSGSLPSRANGDEADMTCQPMDSPNPLTKAKSFVEGTRFEHFPRFTGRY